MPMSYLCVSAAGAEWGADGGTHGRVALGRGAAADIGGATDGGAKDERDAWARSRESVMAVLRRHRGEATHTAG
jgi:hypothetical protein